MNHSKHDKSAINAGRKWTKKDDQLLAQYIKEGLTYQEIGKLLGRTGKAVSIRVLIKRKASRSFNNFIDENPAAPQAKPYLPPTLMPMPPQPYWSLILAGAGIGTGITTLVFLFVDSLK